MSLKTGYIICPTDTTPSKYIETCYKTESVSIITELGQVYHNCKIDINTLQEIEFPDVEKKEINGSLVVWAYDIDRDIPIIIGTFSKTDEGRFLLSKQYRFSKTYGNNSATQVIDGKSAQVIITTQSDDSTEVIIRSISENNNAKVLIETNGKFHVRTSGVAQIQATEILLGNTKLEAAVLGNTLVDEVLKPLFSEIKKLTVSTAFGPSSVPINNPQFIQIEKKIDEILSLLVKLQ